MKKFITNKIFIFVVVLTFCMITISCILLAFSGENDNFYASTITSSSIYQTNKDIFDQLANEIKAESTYSNLQANSNFSNAEDLKAKEVIVDENGKLNLYGVAYSTGSYTISGQQSRAHFVFWMSISYDKQVINNNEQIRFTGLQIGIAAVYDSARPQYIDVNYGQYGFGDNWAMSEKNQSYLNFERTFNKGWVYEVAGNFGVTADVYYKRGPSATLNSTRFQLNYR